MAYPPIIEKANATLLKNLPGFRSPPHTCIPMFFWQQDDLGEQPSSTIPGLCECFSVLPLRGHTGIRVEIGLRHPLQWLVLSTA